MTAFNWQEFLQTLGGQAILLAAVGYLIKTLVSSRLEKDAEAFKADLKRNSDMEIERLKSTLQMAAIEHQVRFSKLHEQRAEIISQLSREIDEVPDAIRSYLNHDLRNKAALTAARIRAFKLIDLIRINRIILPPRTCELLDQFSDVLLHITLNLTVFWGGEGSTVRSTANTTPEPEWRTMKNEVRKNAETAFAHEIPALQSELIEDLRGLLAGSSD